MKTLAFGTAIFCAALAPIGTVAAVAGPPCDPSSRFTLSANQVVDTKTGLTWQRGVAPVSKTWAEASSYCPTVGANFRVPSKKELLTIVDYTKFTPAIDKTVFPGTTATKFWTSSLSGDDPSYANFVDFDEGGTNTDAVASKLAVRCVR